MTFMDMEIIHTYTREDALRDGVLVDRFSDGRDINDLSQEAGITWPVVFTAAAFAETVKWDEEFGFQDETGRAWDIFFMAKNALKRNMVKHPQITPGHRVPVEFMCVPPKRQRPKLTTLHMVLAPLDNGAPSWVFMLPHED